MRWIFRRHNKPEPGDIAAERYETDFTSALGGLKPLFRRLRPGGSFPPFSVRHRFREENTESYGTEFSGDALTLRLKRSHLFAWTLAEPYRYRDFLLEMDTAFGEGNNYSSVGAVIRYADEYNYYYFLVSNRGYFRFDAVFNGNPIPLIPWTSIAGDEAPDDSPAGGNRRFSIRIIAHASNFSFYIDDKWAGEVDDETIDAGFIGFAGQNYGAREDAVFRIERLLIESRPVEVEIHYYRWTKFLKASPERRITLARRFLEMGQAGPALVQLKRAYKGNEPDADGLFLLVESYVAAGVYSQALQTIDLLLEREPEHREAIIEKANILYLENRFLDLTEYLSRIIVSFPEHAPLHNLYGNGEYALGNWEAAADFYKKAMALEPDQPIFLVNAAKALDQAGKKTEALEYYLEASRLLFRQEAYDDLTPLFYRVRRLDSKNREVSALEGKVLFHEGKIGEAERIFTSLLEEGYRESSVVFMKALILALNGEAGVSLELFREAAEKEPGYPLFQLKYAEALYGAGEAPDGPLQNALKAAPDDPWVLNFAGLMAMERKDFAAAAEYLEKAWTVLPREPDIAENYSTALLETKGYTEAVAVIDGSENREDPLISGRMANHRGNLCVRAGRLEEAEQYYRRAHSLEPDDPVFLENLGALLLKLGKINEAEEHLTKIPGIGVLPEPGKTSDLEVLPRPGLSNSLHTPSPRVYSFLAEIAEEKGESRRAELCYTEGMRIFPSESSLPRGFSEYLLRRNRPEEALETAELAEVLSRHTESEEENRRFLEKVRNIVMNEFRCGGCGKSWMVPKNLPRQNGIKLRGAPSSDSPAGKCGSCGKVWCVACVSDHVKDDRFVCPECGVPLKLSEDYLVYLAVKYAGEA